MVRGSSPASIRWITSLLPINRFPSLKSIFLIQLLDGDGHSSPSRSRQQIAIDDLESDPDALPLEDRFGRGERGR